MPKILQLRRGTTAELAANTPASGELFVDTQQKTVTVGDGSLAGGTYLARDDRVSVVFTTANGANGLAAGAYNQANVTIGVDATQNTRLNSIETINTNQNTSISIIQGVDAGQNTSINNASTLAQAAYNQANTATAAADLSQVSEDILPAFSEIYDIGSTDKRWYNGYFSNNLNIDGAEILGSEAGISIPEALLTGELLFTDNLITPDSSTAIQYFGNKGVVVVNGNLDVQGDWLGAPVVQTIAEILAVNAGSRDTSFDIGTGFIYWPNALAIQSDDKILVGGQFTSYNGTTQNRITRLNDDGSLDTSFDIGTGFNDQVRALAIQSDGKIIVGGVFASYNGTTQNRITRLNTDGSRDASFNIGTGFNSPVNAIAIQSDGKIIVGGQFTGYNGTTQSCIVRLNTDGSRDASFNIGTGFDGPVNAIDIQSDGKIVVGGEFSNYNGTTQNLITRLNTDGSRDASFNIGTGFDTAFFSNRVNAIAIQSDGKIIVGGQFTGYNGTSQNYITRLSTDGSRDTSFDIGTGFNATVNALTIQSDGKIIVGGVFGTYNGATQSKMARLNTDGSLDTSFDIGTGFNTSVTALSIQLNNKVIIGGEFTDYNGTTQNYITRLSTGVQAVPGVEVPLLGEKGMIRYNKDVSAFQGYDGTKWELLERVTTPPTSLQTTGTVDVDFSGATLRTQGLLTGDITYTGSKYSVGNSVTIRVINGSTERTLSFPTDWIFVGAKPTTIAADKNAILTLTSFGTTESDCVASWAAQS